MYAVVNLIILWGVSFVASWTKPQSANVKLKVSRMVSTIPTFMAYSKTWSSHSGFARPHQWPILLKINCWPQFKYKKFILISVIFIDFHWYLHEIKNGKRFGFYSFTNLSIKKITGTCIIIDGLTEWIFILVQVSYK